MSEPQFVEQDEITTQLPWERQTGESTAAWAAFVCYRDIGLKRTLDLVSQRLYPSAPAERPASARPPRRHGRISNWSRQHDWVSRAAAWDAEVDRIGRISQIEAVREMNARHVVEARALQAKALEALRRLTPEDVEPADLLRFIVEATRLERLALGEPTEKVRQDVRAEGTVTLEVVERIVAIREDDRLPARVIPSTFECNSSEEPNCDSLIALPDLPHALTEAD